jgi:hypothetical protein
MRAEELRIFVYFAVLCERETFGLPGGVNGLLF